MSLINVVFPDYYKEERRKQVAYRIRTAVERMQKNEIRINQKIFNAYKKDLRNIDVDIAKDLRGQWPLPTDNTLVRGAITSNTYICGIDKNGRKCVEHFVAHYNSRYVVKDLAYIVVNIYITGVKGTGAPLYWL